MDFSTFNNSSDVQKYLQQAERKREYNKTYYQSKVKPKKETTKQTLDFYREKCEKLELELYQLQNAQIYEEKYKDIMTENVYLAEQLEILTQENNNLRGLLEAARQRNHDIMLKRASEFLPPLQNLCIF